MLTSYTCTCWIRVDVKTFESGKKKMGIKKYPDTYERGVAFRVVYGGLGSFINDWGDGSENVKKAVGLWSKTTTLHVHHSLFCAFLCRHCTRLRPEVSWRTLTRDDEFFFLFLDLKMVPKKLSRGIFAYIWHFQRTGINVAKCKNREFIFKVMFSLLSQWSMLKLAYISTHAAML